MNKCYKKTFIHFSIIISLSILILSFSSCNFAVDNKITIGIVNLTPKLDTIITGFKSGMAGHGYISEYNINYIYNGALKNSTYLEQEIKDFVTLGVDLIFSATTSATIAAKELTKGTNIPVVFAPVFNPVKSGIVKSLTGHGTNLTGVWVGGSTAKALEYLLAISPNTSRVFVPFIQNDKAAGQSLTALNLVAEKLNVQLVVSEVHSDNDLIKSLNSMPPGIDAIWLLNSPTLVSNVASYSKAAIQNKLPLASGTSQYESGVLISYGQQHFKTGEQASHLAHKILRGVAPSDLMIEQCNFILGINLQTAQAIGIEIPVNILNQSDFLIR